MWLLSFVPDALLALVINGVLIAGIVGFTASFFFGFVVRYLPTIAPYRMMIQVVSIILLVAGVYFKGGYIVEMSWRARVAEMEQKVALAEEKAKTANAEIRTVYVDKVRVVKETQVVIQEKIKDAQVKIDSQCTVVPEVVTILNEAAKAKK
jgi:hypothetical protein